MKLYSTNSPHHLVSLKTAVLKGLPADNGLFMPVSGPPMDPSFINHFSEKSFPEIAFDVALHLIGDAIPKQELYSIIQNSINFPAPLVSLDDTTFVLELFHGPSLAFKDFGARFMAQMMSYFNRGEDQQLTILVATSGDTGGAVAAGFYNTPGINVVILYPSGKVSFLQEQQLTTLGGNITALEINGTFDDCQSLVKQAFLDSELSNQKRLASANSINIARLIPQSFYYFEAYKQIPDKSQPVVFSVPSGNFGNLTAGLLAKKLGLPVSQFLAATNINDVVPEYLSTGDYHPRPSQRTLSNAMDVGNPSNFSRMLDIYSSTWNKMRLDIQGYAYTDQETKEAIIEVKRKYNYIIDPHGAVGYLALKNYQTKAPDTTGIILETAHPAKFLQVMETILNEQIHVPSRLSMLRDKKKKSLNMDVDFTIFKEWLLDNL